MELIYFFSLAIIALAAAAGVIASRSTVHSALFMIVNLFCIAMLYLSLAAEFLAVVQITVYAGAIMVLFLFVITMLNPAREEEPNRIRNRLPVAIGLVLLFLGLLLLPLQPAAMRVAAPMQAGAASAGTSNLEALGGMLFTRYLLPFELTSLLLIVAMVAAIVLAKRRA